MIWLGIVLLAGSCLGLGALIMGVLVFGSSVWWGEEEFEAEERAEVPPR